MVYVQEIISHVSQESNSSFLKTLGTQAVNFAASCTPQAYDGDDIL